MKPVSQTYNIVMERGPRPAVSKRFLHVRSDCAANAIGQALRKYPGYIVVECYTGGLYHENPKFACDFARLDYDIPPHRPFEEQAPEPPAVDATLPMFNADDIAKESEAARARKAQP